MYASDFLRTLSLLLAATCRPAHSQAFGLGEQDSNKSLLFQRATPYRNPPKLRTPIAEILPKAGSDGAEEVYRESLGAYSDNLRPLFENFDNPEERFYHAKVADYLYHENPERYSDEDVEFARAAEDGAAQYGEPFGRLSARRSARSANVDEVYTAFFDPGSPADICKAWTTLAAYCGGDDERCVCSSGTYYVPDQWNSLAAGCAKLGVGCRDLGSEWCSLADAASEYSDWCRSGPDDVLFALAPNAPVETPADTTSSIAAPSEGLGMTASAGQNVSLSVIASSATPTSFCDYVIDSATYIGACDAFSGITSSSAQAVGNTASATPSSPSTVSGQARMSVDVLGVAVVLLALTYALCALS